MALYSISKRDLDLAIHHLSKDPLLGKAVAGESGIRRWRIGDHDILYHPLEQYTLIVLLQIRPAAMEEPRVKKQAIAILKDMAKFVAKEGVKKWLGR